MKGWSPLRLYSDYTIKRDKNVCATIELIIDERQHCIVA